MRLDPEWSHEVAVGLLAAISSSRPVLEMLRSRMPPDDPRLATRVFGLAFRNPLGVAAGFDKDGRAVAALAALGFGAVEVGTITPRPQPGNPKPRLYRLIADQALVNRLGFNSQGAAQVHERLETLHHPDELRCVVGVNVGRNRDTPQERAPADYVHALLALSACGDYVTVNVSSPNTAGLRQLQEATSLRKLVEAVLTAERDLSTHEGRDPRPVLVKLAPDLDDASLDAALDAAAEAGATGFIAVNTTTQRPPGLRSPDASEAGGLSGAPLFPRALEVVRRAFRRFDGRMPIVGVGGVTDGERAHRLIRAGASLVQAYTGFVYGGPSFPQRVLAGLAAELKARGTRSVAEAVGADA